MLFFLVIFGTVAYNQIRQSSFDDSLFSYEDKIIAKVERTDDPIQNSRIAASYMNVLQKPFTARTDGVTEKNQEIELDKEAAQQEILSYSYDEYLQEFVIEHRRKDKIDNICRTYLKGITKIQDVSKKALKYFYDRLDELRDKNSRFWNFSPASMEKAPSKPISDVSSYVVDMRGNWQEYLHSLKSINQNSRVVHINAYIQKFNFVDLNNLDRFFGQFAQPFIEAITNNTDKVFVINLGDDSDEQPSDVVLSDVWKKYFYDKLPKDILQSRVIFCAPTYVMKAEAWQAAGLSKIENRDMDTFDLWVEGVEKRSAASEKIMETIQKILTIAPQLTADKIKKILMNTAIERELRNKTIKLLDVEKATAEAKDISENTKKNTEILNAQRDLQNAYPALSSFKTLWRHGIDLSGIKYKTLDSDLIKLIFDEADSVFKKDAVPESEEKLLENKINYIKQNAPDIFRNNVGLTLKLPKNIQLILQNKGLIDTNLLNANSTESMLAQIHEAKQLAALDTLFDTNTQSIKNNEPLRAAFIKKYLDIPDWSTSKAKKLSLLWHKKLLSKQEIINYVENRNDVQILLDGQILTKEDIKSILPKLLDANPFDLQWLKNQNIIESGEALIHYVKEGGKNIAPCLKFLLENKWLTREGADLIYPHIIKNNIDIADLLDQGFFPPPGEINKSYHYPIKENGKIIGETKQTILAYMLTKNIDISRIIEKYGNVPWTMSNDQEFLQEYNYHGQLMPNTFSRENRTESVLKLLKDRLEKNQAQIFSALNAIAKAYLYENPQSKEKKQFSSVDRIRYTHDRAYLLQIINMGLHLLKNSYLELINKPDDEQLNKLFKNLKWTVQLMHKVAQNTQDKHLVMNGIESEQSPKLIRDFYNKRHTILSLLTQYNLLEKNKATKDQYDNFFTQADKKIIEIYKTRPQEKGEKQDKYDVITGLTGLRKTALWKKLNHRDTRVS